MNKTICTVSIFVGLLFILAGCQGNPENGTISGNGTDIASQETQTMNEQMQKIHRDPDPAMPVQGNGAGSKQAGEQQTNSPDLNKLLQLQQQLNDIVKTGKIENCAQITDPTYNESCQAHMLVGKAKSNTDTAVCDAGTTDNIKKLCELYLGQIK